MERLDALLDAALQAQTQAHAPYSHFKVGAALIDAEGRLHKGCNVENAAYPVGTCAEAGAIAAMVAGGGRRIAAMLVIGSGAEPCFPCGACRQRIAEFGGVETTVIAASAGGERQVSTTLGALLPHAFGPDALP